VALAGGTATGLGSFVKGHGTGNDFVILPDLAGELGLSAGMVRRLCDRRFGIGADGVLRAVATENDPEVAGLADQAPFFMDYRNADGSLAAMCGNGLRVFARYLVDAGLASPGQFQVATRGGVRTVTVPAGDPAADITVAMGPPVFGTANDLKVAVGDPASGGWENSWPAHAVWMPNPHAVCFVEDVQDAGPLQQEPAVTPQLVFPHGVNVEFVVRCGPSHLRMRVYERGVGETLSCGTGACAAAVAAMSADYQIFDCPSEPYAYRVDVPGGQLQVVWRPDGEVELAGPAVLVAAGKVMPDWLGATPS
jgi:diaminopimelate epimerase